MIMKRNKSAALISTTASTSSLSPFPSKGLIVDLHSNLNQHSSPKGAYSRNNHFPHKQYVDENENRQNQQLWQQQNQFLNNSKISKHYQLNSPHNNSNNYAYYQTLQTQTQQLQHQSLGALEKELQRLKQREKSFYKLNGQVKLLEKKSKAIQNQNRGIRQNTQDESQEIARLKAEIQGVTSDIKTIDIQAKQIVKQLSQSKQQLICLQNTLESVKQKNRVQLAKNMSIQSKLSEKLQAAEQTKDSTLQSQKGIQNLRGQIKQYQNQSQGLEQEIEGLRYEREASRKDRQRLQHVIDQLKKQVSSQREHQKHVKAKLSEMQQAKQHLKQQLYQIKQSEQTLTDQLNAQQQSYHQLCRNVSDMQLKLKCTRDELQMTTNDVQELTELYVGQAKKLQQEQKENEQVNDEFDQISKEAIDVWQTITELLKVQQVTGDSRQNKVKSKRKQANDHLHLQLNLNFGGYQQESNNMLSKDQIKSKVTKCWNQIRAIIEQCE